MKKQKIPEDFLKTSELGQILVPIADRLKSLSHLKAAFENCVAFSADNGKPLVDPFQLVAALKSTRQAAIAALPSAENTYETLRQWAAAESEKVTALFDPRLRAFCERQGFKLAGQHPSYLIDGFLSVRVNQGTRETDIGPRSIPSLMLDTIAPAISELVKEERARKFDRAQFLELLYQAYERCFLLNSAALGDPIPVRKVYQELVVLQQPEAFLKSAKKALFREYTVELFARDLAKLLESGPCQTTGGKWLSDRPTSFTADGIPILQQGQARIVGKIVFSAEHP